MNIDDSKILMQDESYVIRGAIFDVYKEMGHGFLESVYHECLMREFTKRNIPFASQQELTIFYKGEALEQTYIPDFICHDKIIVEIKAISATQNVHTAQVLNYLKATKMKLGLLVNFGSAPKVSIERIVF